MSDFVTCPGGHLKAIADHVIGGFAVYFSDEETPDREGDYFTKATDFGIENGDSRPGYYWHRLAADKEPLGRARFQLRPERGLWVEMQLKSNQAGAQVFALAKRNELAFSSASSAHLVTKERMGKSHWISSWPLVEISVLPTAHAAEPRAEVVALKSLTSAYAPLVERPEREAIRRAEMEFLFMQTKKFQREFQGSLTEADQAEMRAYYSALSETAIKKIEKLEMYR